MGRAEGQGYFEDPRMSWQMRVFSSDPLNRSLRPFARRQHPMQRCRCCLSLHRCSELEAIVNLNADVMGLGRKAKKYFNKLHPNVLLRESLNLPEMES